MKLINRGLATGMTIAIAVFFVCGFNACSEQSPLGHSDDGSERIVELAKNGRSAKLKNDTNATSASDSSNGSASGGLEFMSLQGGVSSGDSAEPGAEVLMEVAGYVTFAGGGELILEYKGVENPQDNNGNLYVKSTFKIFSETISEDAELALTLYDNLGAGDVDVTFQPHGIVFSQPALLNIEIKDADLSGVDASTIGLYYVNQDSGQWERMNTYDIIVKQAEGYMKIIDAEIPHFSRYAVAWSN